MTLSDFESQEATGHVCSYRLTRHCHFGESFLRPDRLTSKFGTGEEACFTVEHGLATVGSGIPASPNVWDPTYANMVWHLIATRFCKVTTSERQLSTGSTMLPNQWCGLRPSVLGQDRSETKKIGLGLGLGLASCGLGLGLAVLVLFCETWSCNARRHNDLEGHSNFLKYYL